MISIAIIAWLGHLNTLIIIEYEKIDELLCSLFTLAESLVLARNKIGQRRNWLGCRAGMGRRGNKCRRGVGAL